MRRFNLFSALLLGLLLAGCNGATQPQETPSEPLAEAADDSALEHAAKHLDPTYVCPMHPQIMRDEPGSCPICGMDLVPEAPAAHEPAPTVTVDDFTARAMHLQTEPVARGTLWKYIETVGEVAYDEDRLHHVHPRTSGWIEGLKVSAEGEPVKTGQVLFQLYSPEVVAAQEDLLLEVARGRSARLRASAVTRLKWLDVDEATIERIQKRGEVQRTVPVHAPAGGFVSALEVRDGMYVTPDMELFTIADLSQIWVLAEIYGPQLDWVTLGRPAEIRIPALPGQLWEGEVDFVYPELDPVTRTLRVRLRFDNPEGLLKPNMFAEVVIYGGPRRDVLHVDRSAVIPSAEGPRVVVRTEEAGYRPVAVETGMHARDRVEILAGLAEGDEVVVNGQFLLDSESQLQASLRRLGGEPPADAHAHH